VKCALGQDCTGGDILKLLATEDDGWDNNPAHCMLADLSAASAELLAGLSSQLMLA